jgi:hypothetical protein
MLKYAIYKGLFIDQLIILFGGNTMKRSFYLIVSTLIILNAASGCMAETSQSEKAAPVKSNPSPEGYNGTVVETMNTAGYTYVQVDTGKDKIWAAAPEFQVKVGDLVTVPQGALMQNYQSKTLNRTFPQIYFVSGISVAGAEPAPGKMPPVKAGAPHDNIIPPTPSNIDLSGIKKAEGGKSVAELYANKDSLSGKEVTIRGKVVKFSASIMGKNWIHLQDGTGGTGTNDLTVTTSATAAVGDTVVVKGVLATDKDFGYGYKYDVILEDATVTVE